MAVNLPDWISDVRMPVAGDSFSWYSVEGTLVKDTLVIHHSVGENDDAFSIANFHVNSRGYGGIGYHLVILKDGTIQYAGDLETMRAHVANQNQHKVGICLTGNLLNHPPTEAQLKATRRLIDFFIAPNDVLPKVNGYEAVTYHNAVVGQSTACPGHASPNFNAWFNYLKGGAFPDSLYAKPAPKPEPTPEPRPVPPDSQGSTKDKEQDARLANIESAIAVLKELVELIIGYLRRWVRFNKYEKDKK